MIARLVAWPLVACCLILATCAFGTSLARADGEPCGGTSVDGDVFGNDEILISGHCAPSGDVVAGVLGPPTRVVACGVLSTNGVRWDVATCGVAQTTCPVRADDTGQLVQTMAFATQTKTGPGGTWATTALWCAGGDARVATLADVRQAVLRLIPTTTIGAAPKSNTLVNAQTILWAATTTVRDLGTVTVVGIKVHVRLAFAYADWNYGDGHGDQHTTPGRVYDTVADPCHTRLCRGYQGHIYQQPGIARVGLTVYWHASYSTDNRTWIDVDPAPLPGPDATAAITVRQARAVLVPNK